MKYEIKNRYTGAVQFTAEIDCSDDASDGTKRGLAVKWAVTNGANLSGADLGGADLSGAYLSRADLSGAKLSRANLSGANLIDANLSGAYLYGAVLRDANLSGAKLYYADLSGADLSGADLSGADLSGAVLRGAVLRGADFGIDAPLIPDIHKAVYAAASVPGALDMSDWHHACGTTHCRAGWVVTLAGDEGKALEDKVGTPVAATLIYFASDPTMEKVPDFHCGNDAALADMKAMAERD